jgi:O-antigen/teichoic acid export membrane protein
MFISLYATRLVLAALGISDFGIFNVVGGAIVMLTFLNNAMATATQRFMSFAQGEGDEDRQKSIFNVSVILHSIIGLILVFILEGAGYFLFNGILKIDVERLDVAKLIYHFLVISTFVNVISVPYDAVINAHENMLFVAVLGIIEASLKLSIALFVTYTGFDKLASYGFLMATLAIFLLLIQRFYCHKKYKEVQINIQKFYDKALFKEMTTFGGWSLLGSTAGLVSYYGQGIVINMFFGTIVNAAQGVANQISGQLGAFSGTMIKALNPVIAKSEGAGERDIMLQASISGSKFSYFLLAFFAIPVFIEMPFILNFWLKEVPEYTIMFCRLLLLINLIEQMFVTLPTSISATGDIKNYQIIVSILAIVPLIMSYFFFKLGYPPQTLYFIFIGHRIIRAFGPLLYFTKIKCGLSPTYFIKEVVLRCLAISLIVAFLSMLPLLVFDSGVMRLVIILTISSLSFLFSIKWFGLSSKEGEQIELVIKRLVHKFKR